MAGQPPPATLQIPGIQVLEELGRGSQCIVYRVIREDKEYALKINRKDSKAASAAQFRREAAILARLKHPGLPQVYEVGEHPEGTYEIMELVRGRTLDTSIGAQAIDEDSLLRLGKVLAGALVEIHIQGLIHRDIKPQNIITSEGLSDGKLIDFGFAADASTFEKEGDATVGTFLYSAPEQLGALQRQVDHRSDLYALGVVFFECATGKPPFMATEIGELIRMHAVQTPPMIDQVAPKFSPAFAGIVAKLMAKDPDDRYQSAKSLLKDLEEIKALQAVIAKGENPVLGAGHEDSHHAGVRTGELPLAGRKDELDVMTNAWNRVLKGKSAVILLQGGSGSGKSRLVREFLRSTSPNGERLNENGTARLLTGKCTQAQGISFAPIREAIESYLHLVGNLPAESRATALKSVRAAAGDFVPMLRHLSPALSALFANETDQGGQDESQDLFYGAIARFLVGLGAGSTHLSPLILYIDDIQWLDDSSQKVLAALVAQIKEVPILIICTSRNHEENRAKLDKINKMILESADSSLSVSEINVAPLGTGAIGELISSHLGGYKPEAHFVEQILKRTDGSPFAIGEYLRAMLEAGLIRPYWGSWRLNMEGLETLNLPKDVIQLVLKRIETLNEKSREVLSIAAVLGTTFKSDILAKVAGLEPAALQSVEYDATQAKLLERNEQGLLCFIHDRVQEAFLVRLEEGPRRQIHQNIAEILEREENGGGSESVEHLLTLARHYIQGEREKNPAKLYQVCLKAARAALSSFANGDAYSLLQEARTAVNSFGVRADPDHDELSAIAAQKLQLYDEAIECFKDAIAKCEDLQRRASMRTRLIRIYTVNLQNAKAFEQMNRAFLELDLKHPSLSPAYFFLGFWDTLVSFLIWTTGIMAGKVPERKRPELQTHVHLYEASIVFTYYNLQAVLSVLLMGRALRVVARLGHGPEMAAILYRVAPAFRWLKLDNQTEKWAKRATQVAERAGEPSILANAAAMEGTACIMIGQDVKGEIRLRDALEKHGNWLSTEDYFAMAGALRWTYGMRGYIPEQLTLLDHQIERLASMGGQSDFLKSHFLSWIYSTKMVCLVIRGLVADALETKAKLDALNLNNGFDRLHAYGYTMSFYFEQGELGEPAEEAIRCFENLAEAFEDKSIPIFLHQGWLFRAQLRLAQARVAGPKERPQAIEKLKKALAGFKEIISTPVIEAHYLLLQAGLHLMENKPRQAQQAISKAERFGGEQGAPWIIFEVHHQRALLFRHLGNEHSTSTEAQIAFDLAERYGWKIRANQVATEFSGVVTERTSWYTSNPLKSSIESGTFRTTLNGTNAGHGNLRLQQQLSSLLQVSLSSASVLNPDLQAKTVLDEIVRVLKAERAFLLVSPDLDPNGKMEHQAGRDAHGRDLSELQGYSQTVIRQVRTTGKPLIVSGTEQGAVSASESVVVHGLKSIMAAPVKIRGEVVGVVYLDNRLAKGIFTQEDIEILEALAAHIAVSMEVSRTLRIEMERQSLRESVDRLSSLLANVPVILFELDPKGICRIAAGKSFDTIGMSSTEAMGCSMPEVFRDHPAMTESLKRALEGETFSSMVELSERVFEMYFQPMRDSAGNLGSVIAVAIDNTERKRAEALLANSSKLSALGEMAGGVAHEINNPLAIINMMAGQLQEIITEDGATPPPDAIALLTKIQSTVERIAKIVKGLRSFAREAQHDPTQRESIKSIVDDTLALCTEKFKAHGVGITVEPSQEDIWIPCRSTQISQVLLNLMNNAYDAIAEQPERWVKISWAKDGEFARIAVTDCGGGIPPHVVQKIFQPFFTTKPVGSGTGLGLSISKGLIDNHGGRLEYDEKCKNTRFVVVLPLTGVETESVKSKAAA